MKNIVLSLSYDLAITEDFKSYVSPPIYSIILKRKDIKL